MLVVQQLDQPQGCFVGSTLFKFQQKALLALCAYGA